MITEIEPGTTQGDLWAFYETFFEGVILVDEKKREIDLSKIVIRYPDYSHYDFLIHHIRSLGYSVKGDPDVHRGV